MATDKPSDNGPDIPPPSPPEVPEIVEARKRIERARAVWEKRTPKTYTKMNTASERAAIADGMNVPPGSNVPLRTSAEQYGALVDETFSSVEASANGLRQQLNGMGFNSQDIQVIQNALLSLTKPIPNSNSPVKSLLVQWKQNPSVLRPAVHMGLAHGHLNTIDTLLKLRKPDTDQYNYLMQVRGLIEEAIASDPITEAAYKINNPPTSEAAARGKEALRMLGFAAVSSLAVLSTILGRGINGPSVLYGAIALAIAKPSLFHGKARRYMDQLKKLPEVKVRGQDWSRVLDVMRTKQGNDLIKKLKAGASGKKDGLTKKEYIERITTILGKDAPGTVHPVRQELAGMPIEEIDRLHRTVNEITDPEAMQIAREYIQENPGPGTLGKVLKQQKTP